jgi:hypothetical protein
MECLVHRKLLIIHGWRTRRSFIRKSMWCEMLLKFWITCRLENDMERHESAFLLRQFGNVTLVESQKTALIMSQQRQVHIPRVAFISRAACVTTL